MLAIIIDIKRPHRVFDSNNYAAHADEVISIIGVPASRN